jgi:hypothetical protein
VGAGAPMTPARVGCLAQVALRLLAGLGAQAGMEALVSAAGQGAVAALADVLACAPAELVGAISWTGTAPKRWVVSQVCRAGGLAYASSVPSQCLVYACNNLCCCPCLAYSVVRAVFICCARGKYNGQCTTRACRAVQLLASGLRQEGGPDSADTAAASLEATKARAGGTW